MSFTHSDIVRRFVEGKTNGKGSRMFIDGDTLYSHGHWFPLMVRTQFGLLMNGDRRSVSTSQHQSLCMRHAKVIIPFSILDRAGLKLHGICLLAKEEARWDQREYVDKEGKTRTVTERRPDSCLLSDANANYWLSSMDNYSYFMTRLPYPVETVADAFSALKPSLTLGLNEGEHYFRQGEWFFIPVSGTLYSSMKVANRKKGRVKEKRFNGQHRYRPEHFLKNRNEQQQPHHYATEYGEISGCPFYVVRGQVRHSQGDHPMLKLGKEWFLAIESNHQISFGAGGRID